MCSIRGVSAAIGVLVVSPAIIGACIGWSVGMAIAGDDRFSATVNHVSDGDTVQVVPFGGCRPSVLCPLTLRIVGIDTPESRSGGGLGGAKCDKEKRLGIIAKAWAKQTLEGRTVAVIPLPQDLQDDPRGRLLGTIQVGGSDYSAMAIKTGHAVAYDPAKNGFQKPDWCH